MPSLGVRSPWLKVSNSVLPEREIQEMCYQLVGFVYKIFNSDNSFLGSVCRGSKVLLSNIYTVLFVQDLQWHNHLTIWHFSANHFADFCFAQWKRDEEMKKTHFLFSFLFGRKVQCFLEFSNSKIKAIWFPSGLFCTLHSRKNGIFLTFPACF